MTCGNRLCRQVVPVNRMGGLFDLKPTNPLILPRIGIAVLGTSNYQTL